ncbi:hypothetical protein OVA29_21735 [Exiguobacterium sp. SL14]|nr:hypothetical protein [Exiguobacterium sp. SL14]MCY1692740.1 hypothetical protein [Exiguobacterium sp. SL14]
MKTLANFRKDFEEILEDPNTNRRDVRLANLMSEMEGAIQIPPPQKPQRETPPPEEIKLYREISNARVL